MNKEKAKAYAKKMKSKKPSAKQSTVNNFMSK
jgi:hypothetical protein